jgi:hypothetical protein
MTGHPAQDDEQVFVVEKGHPSRGVCPPPRQNTLACRTGPKAKNEREQNEAARRTPMSETEKDLQRYVFLLSCLGIIVAAGHGATSRPWCLVLGTFGFFVGLRYARAATAGNVPATRLLAVLSAGLLVSGSTMVVSNLYSLQGTLVLMAVKVAERSGRLTDLILWVGRSVGFIVLIVIIALVLLRLAAARATTGR